MLRADFLYTPEPSAHTSSEVRKHEGRKKEASILGNFRPQASCDPVRAYGKPKEMTTACFYAGIFSARLLTAVSMHCILKETHECLLIYQNKWRVNHEKNI